MIPAAMAMTAPTSVLSTSFVSRVINGVVVKQPDDEDDHEDDDVHDDHEDDRHDDSNDKSSQNDN